jgi:cytochrome b561
MEPARSDRYTRTAVVLHWAIAAMVIAQFAWGWWMQTIPKEPVGPRLDAFNLHKSIGLTLLVLTLVRLGWRTTHAPPPLPAMAAWQRRLARANHALLYAVVVAMPVVGYLGSAFSGYPVKYFGWTLPAWSAKQDDLKSLMSALHLGLGFVLAGAVLLHVAGVARHTAETGWALLSRMGWRSSKPAPPQYN